MKTSTIVTIIFVALIFGLWKYWTRPKVSKSSPKQNNGKPASPDGAGNTKSSTTTERIKCFAKEWWKWVVGALIVGVILYFAGNGGISVPSGEALKSPGLGDLGILTKKYWLWIFIGLLALYVFLKKKAKGFENLVLWAGAVLLLSTVYASWFTDADKPVDQASEKSQNCPFAVAEQRMCHIPYDHPVQIRSKEYGKNLCGTPLGNVVWSRVPNGDGTFHWNVQSKDPRGVDFSYSMRDAC